MASSIVTLSLLFLVSLLFSGSFADGEHEAPYDPAQMPEGTQPVVKDMSRPETEHQVGITDFGLNPEDFIAGTREGNWLVEILGDAHHNTDEFQAVRKLVKERDADIKLGTFRCSPALRLHGAWCRGYGIDWWPTYVFLNHGERLQLLAGHQDSARNMFQLALQHSYAEATPLKKPMKENPATHRRKVVINQKNKAAKEAAKQGL
eukprot:TRINITY_DN10946_c0_g1_i1.p1 TRINITY_DN10946_c0_g1~~TRINITY_DN10946_c0_g1_i1.p1  ORF type:complete len:217 (+),score=66.37 TRINITY_DN10946_c0_g1_i1:37-651(+)